MRAILTVEAGQAAPHVYELPPDQITILGRNRKCTVVLGDEHSSRRHAQILNTGGRWVLRDLGTLNGTRLNGRRVEQHPLESNQVISIGRTRFRFTMEETATSTPALPDPTAEMPGLAGQPVGDAVDLHGTILAADELTSLCDFMGVSVSESDPRALLRRALEAVLRQTRAELVGYLSLDDPDPLPKLVLPERAHVDAHLSRRLTKEVQKTGRTVWLAGREGPPPESGSLASMRDAVCVPLRDGDSYLGALHAYVANRQFTDRDVRFCEILAGHLANSLRLLRNRRTLEAENIRLKRRATEGDQLIGDSPPMQKLRMMIARAGASQSTVLIVGDSGSGKELVARALHQQSRRQRGPFVAHNCAAVNPTLLESALFGHVKGSFTGADNNRPGLFQLADEGTLFLDEIGEMSLECQAKVLRVIEGHGFWPVGSQAPLHTDVRILAATHRDLEEEVRAGRFRQDLYFRLRVVLLPVPRLRDRAEDVSELAACFLDKLADQYGRKVTLSAAALKRLQEFSWPGNVRQLRAVLESAVIMSESDVLQPEDLVLGPGAPPSRLPTLNLDELEVLAIQEAMEQMRGNVTQAAKVLNISRDTLTNKLRKIPHVRPDGWRPAAEPVA